MVLIKEDKEVTWLSVLRILKEGLQQPPSENMLRNLFGELGFINTPKYTYKKRKKEEEKQENIGAPDVGTWVKMVQVSLQT